MKLTKEQQTANNNIAFHSYWKKAILKVVKGAIYCGFEQYQDKYFLKVRTQDKKEAVFQLAGTPNDLTNEVYEKLIKEIINEQI
jgi:coproporphyrinogen III oxidase